MSLDSIFKLSVIVGMIDQLTGPMSRVNTTVGSSVSQMDKMNKSFGSMAKEGLMVAGLGAGIVAAVLAPVGATFDTQKALSEMSSLGVEDLKLLEDAARNFSDTWAGTTKAEFITAAYDIKSGISSLTDEGVADFTELSGLTAKATKSTIGEMTSLFATGYGIYKGFYSDLSDIEFGEMFSAGIAGSVKAFKTTGSGMAQSIQALGGSATSALVPLEEQLSILGMLQATMSGSEAGTKYKAFLATAARAGETLNLSFTDANNQLVSMPEILGELRGKFGETMDAAEKMELQKAFGTDEAVAMIDLLYGKTGDLQTNILSLYDSMGNGTSATQAMAEAINAPPGEQFIILKQRIHNVTEEIGMQLIPTFNSLMDKGEQWVSKISTWIGNNQGLVKVLMLITLTVGFLLMAVGSLLFMIGGVGLIVIKTINTFVLFRKVMQSLRGMFLSIRIMSMYAGDGIRAGFKGIVAVGKATVSAIRNVVVGMAQFARQAIMTTIRAMPGLIASVWAFTVALLANPLTWIVIGIVALIAAIILLWNNWDSVVGWLKSTWDATINGIVAGFNWIKNLFSGMPLWLQIAVAAFLPFIGIPLLIVSHWDSIKAYFSNLWNGVKEIFGNGIQGAKDVITGALTWFKESGSKIISTFTEGIKSVISAPVDAVKSGLSKIRDLLPFSDAHEGPLSDLTLSGRRVFETIGTGMEQAQDVPSDITDKAFSRMDLSSNGVKKINLREMATDRSVSSSTTTERENGTTIESLSISVDFSKIKDLPALFKLLKEIEDYINGNGPSPSLA